MDVQNLTDDELVVLLGALKLIAWADGTLSELESATLGELVSGLGPRGEAALVRTRQEIRSPADLRRLAAGVRRPSARTTIFEACARLARADGFDETELDVLDGLDELWRDG